MRDDAFDYSSIPVGYYDKVFHRGKGVQSRWHQQKFQELARHIPRGASLLDIGCGAGTFIGTLGEDVDCTGVDVAKEQIDYALNRYGSATKHFLVSHDGLGVPEDARFDCITMLDVIEHVEQESALRMLRQCGEHLRDDSGSFLMVTTPNYASAWPVIEHVVNMVGEVSYEEQHICKYTAKTLAQLLSRAGFTRVSIRAYMGFAPFVAGVSERFSRWLAEKEIDSGGVARYGLSLLAFAHKGSEA